MRADFESRFVGAYRLPIARAEPQSGTEFIDPSLVGAASSRNRPRSPLTFVSLNRLAELLLRANQDIRRALQLTYPFVFVDEFQDTTYAQYDFLLSAFAGGEIAVTAVGDDKQRIMAWAGARTRRLRTLRGRFWCRSDPARYSISDRRQISFGFSMLWREPLTRMRSPTLPKLSGRWTAMSPKSGTARPTAREAEHLARWLANDMAPRGRAPRDYAILVRQKSDDFEADLAEPLAQQGLRLRNESHALGRTTLQDLLSDQLCRIAIALLRLGAHRRAPDAWRLAPLRYRTCGLSIPKTSGVATVETELTAFLADAAGRHGASTPTAENAGRLAARIFAFLDLAAVARTYLEYGTGDLLAIMVEAFELHLAASADRRCHVVGVSRRIRGHRTDTVDDGPQEQRP